MAKEKQGGAPKDDASKGPQQDQQDPQAGAPKDDASADPSPSASAPDPDGAAAAAGGTPPASDTTDDEAPSPIDPSRSDASLLEQFIAEALERSYGPKAAANIAVQRLENLRSGGTGFQLGKQADRTVELTAPDASIGGCSVGGVEYEVKDGKVTVPESHVAALVDHGFTRS